jgi:hypothetical protein
MNNTEFRALLQEVFNDHILMKGRSYHTVNELLHVLRYDDKLKDLQGVNISIYLADGRCICIPCLDAFVDIQTLRVWIEDARIEFEVDEFEYEGEMRRYDNISVYEREVS